MKSIASVFERNTRHRLAAAKIHYETLLFANLALLCQPVIGSASVPVIVIVQREDVGRWKGTTPAAVTLLRSPGAIPAGAADYLLSVTRVI